MTLTNNLPAAAGNTSILFPGFTVTSPTGGVAGLLTQEARAGRHGDLHVHGDLARHPRLLQRHPGRPAGRDGPVRRDHRAAERPRRPPAPPGCRDATRAAICVAPRRTGSESDFRLAAAAYDHPRTCYDREYLFQFSEMDPNIHARRWRRSTMPSAPRLCTSATSHRLHARGADRALPPGVLPDQRPLDAGRHGSELRGPVSAPALQRQSAHASGRAGAAADHRPGPLAASVPRARQPRAHPGARRQPDSDARPRQPNNLAGPLLFTTTTTPGLAMDGIFYWTGKGLNWDAYGHNPGSSDPLATLTCTPDANGYNTGAPTGASTTTSGARTTTSRCRRLRSATCQRRSGDAARPEHLHQRRLVRRQSLPGPERDGARCHRPDTAPTPPSGTIANSPSS